MDFALTDEQTAVRDLAASVLGDHCTPEALRAAEVGDSPGFDRALWAKLAEAGLLGVCIPEEHGGLGLGLVELALLLEEAGRTAAPVPLLGGLGLGALAVVRHGSAAQQAALLPGVASGELLVTAALVEPLGDEANPAATARQDGQSWVLDGTKICVPAGLFADRILVSATTPTGAGLFLVDPAAAGVTREQQDTIAWTPEALLVLDGVVAAPVGALDGSTLADVLQVGRAAVCAVLSGAAEAATRLTGEYTRTREQFGKPIAMFQAVGQRAADCFIDSRTIRLTMLLAVWRLANGLPAEKEVAVAKFYASDAGQRVVRAAAHLHGGMGVSREYPLHRYYVLVKQLELTLGGGTRSLVQLGRLLAQEPVSA
ncbi:MAG: acyl-CoA dehydrogenase [Frankiales bacterium]|nr:MAG: acyl-CoA dehydrogenase [Frankiales bacterium]